MADYRGDVLDFGEAPYNFDQNNNMNYYIRLRLENNKEWTFWGKSLEPLARANRLSPGQKILVQDLGKDEEGRKIWDLSRLEQEANLSNGFSPTSARNKTQETPQEAKTQTPAGVPHFEDELPDSIKNTYIAMEMNKDDAKKRFVRYYDKADEGNIAFEDRQKSLNTSHQDPQTIQNMMDLAERKGWGEIDLKGTDEFRARVWLEASLRGIKTHGYEPKERDFAALKAAQEARTINEMRGKGAPRAPENSQDTNVDYSAPVAPQPQDAPELPKEFLPRLTHITQAMHPETRSLVMHVARRLDADMPQDHSARATLEEWACNYCQSNLDAPDKIVSAFDKLDKRLDDIIANKTPVKDQAPDQEAQPSQAPDVAPMDDYPDYDTYQGPQDYEPYPDEYDNPWAMQDAVEQVPTPAATEEPQQTAQMPEPAQPEQVSQAPDVDNASSATSEPAHTPPTAPNYWTPKEVPPPPKSAEYDIQMHEDKDTGIWEPQPKHALELFEARHDAHYAEIAHLFVAPEKDALSKFYPAIKTLDATDKMLAHVSYFHNEALMTDFDEIDPSEYERFNHNLNWFIGQMNDYIADENGLAKHSEHIAQRKEAIDAANEKHQEPSAREMDNESPATQEAPNVDQAPQRMQDVVNRLDKALSDVPGGKLLSQGIKMLSNSMPNVAQYPLNQNQINSLGLAFNKLKSVAPSAEQLAAKLAIINDKIPDISRGILKLPEVPPIKSTPEVSVQAPVTSDKSKSR